MNSIELFAGAGGLALGLERAGFNHVALVEKDKFACQTLSTNRPQWNVINKNIEDSYELLSNLGDIDLLSGGFPCQPFSYAGNRLGFNDAINGTAFGHMIECIKIVKPKVILFENVAGLLKHDDGRTIATISNAIDDAGYECINIYLLNSSYYNVPQVRKRLFIFAVRKDVFKLEQMGIHPHISKRRYTLRHALMPGYLYDCYCPVSEGKQYPQRKIDLFKHIPQGGYWRDLPDDLKQYYLERPSYGKGGNTGTLRRLSFDAPCLTILTRPDQNQTDRCHPTETRPLTVRECARVQTFPDDWVFCGGVAQQYKQIGNAVPVNFAYAIGKAVYELCKSASEENQYE